MTVFEASEHNGGLVPIEGPRGEKKKNAAKFVAKDRKMEKKIERKKTPGSVEKL